MISLFWIFVGLILYAYFGYPMLITLLSKLKPIERVSQEGTPSVTLLIAAHNEGAVIGQKLDNSLVLDYPPESLQILVAADGSDDDTVDIVNSYAERGVELSYHPDRRGKLAAIGRAMEVVRGDIVVFSDANNMYIPSVIHAVVGPFVDPKVGAVSGSKSISKGDGVLGESESLYWRYESYIKGAESRFGCCVAISGEVWAVRRQLFEPPPPDIINDDFYVGMRVVRQGFKIAYAPQARSFERVSPSARDEKVRRSRIVAGRYQTLARAKEALPLNRPVVMWQIFSHKLLRMFLPFAMIGALVCNALIAGIASGNSNQLKLSPAGPIYFGLLILQVLFYLLAAAGLFIESKSNLLGKILYLPTYVVNSNYAALVGFYRFITGRQTALWERVRRS